MLPLGRGEGHASAGAEPAPSQDRNEASPLQVVSVLTPVAEPRKPLLPQICPGCSRAHPPPHSPAQLAGGGNSLCLPSAAGPCPLLPPAGAMQVRDKCTPRCVGPTPQSPPPGRGPDPPTRGRPHTHARLRLARLTAPPPPPAPARRRLPRSATVGGGRTARNRGVYGGCTGGGTPPLLPPPRGPLRPPTAPDIRALCPAPPAQSPGQPRALSNLGRAGHPLPPRCAIPAWCPPAIQLSHSPPCKRPPP